MNELNDILAEIEARASEMKDTRRHPSTVRMSNDALNLMLTLSEADVPRLVAALRYTFNEWKNATFPDGGYAFDHFDERFGPQVASILAGDGK